ncbi:MAG: dockerin type I domain-containing protein [Bacteroidia bacterium]|nr:dockerin type I domain-containing protein [Bacteroidia bacterium]
MNSRTMLLTVLLIGAMSAGLGAQTIATKPFVELQGTYTEITGTDICTPVGYHDDESYAVNIPFTFYYNANPHTVMYVTTNGYITFGSSQPYIYGQALNNNYDVVSPISRDLHGNYQGTITWAVSGTMPNRVMTVQWKDWMTYYNQLDKLNFQVKFYETSNMIELVYGDWITAATTNTGYVGIRSATAGDVQNRIGQWTGTSASTDGTIAKQYGGAVKPPVGYIYRFGCYVPQGSVAIAMTDALGSPMGYYTTPGMVYARYSIRYPLDQEYDVTITLKFFRIGDPGAQPAHTETFVVHKPLGVLDGVRGMNLNLPPSYYRVEATFSMWNNCLMYEDVKTETSTLFIAPGTQLCEVWPGDVNNDGVVNYGDRGALNKYIFDANLRTLWLHGPARYKIEGQTDPLVYLRWEGQPSVPWYTTEGCYMDADGNGVINNFDYIGVKMNWLRAHGMTPAKPAQRLAAATFDMEQNFPNPFNPGTSVRYSVPERSLVKLRVTDMLGRTVATLVDGCIEEGVSTAIFDSAELPGGQYFATVAMRGLESGLTFSKTIRMTLAR